MTKFIKKITNVSGEESEELMAQMGLSLQDLPQTFLQRPKALPLELCYTQTELD